ncbi:unnamed protein product [Penicillium salamii]|uniref:Uncharacterized protein n=1 Tax=Penicillium salamii TaxID=1612424 RepID=A0A9W4IYX2_9EURO|nr:unnamed protein product [Penicillium salamii]
MVNRSSLEYMYTDVVLPRHPPPAMPRITAKAATQSHVPPLNKGLSTTRSNALHTIFYDGPLSLWEGFAQYAEDDDKARVWRKPSIRLEEQNDAFREEQFVVGDESGAQSRFTQHYGEELSRIFEAQGIDLVFSDFKCAGVPYANIPDTVIMDSSRRLKVVGEIKVPWVLQHQSSLQFEYPHALRQIFAQPIQYMQDLNCTYGFYTTYDETVFLRQILVDGIWQIQYSPVILAESCYRKTSPLSTLSVSVKQCFLYVASLSVYEPPITYYLAQPTWVRHL